MKVKIFPSVTITAILVLGLGLLLLFLQSCQKRSVDFEPEPEPEPQPNDDIVNTMPIVGECSQRSDALSDEDLIKIARRYKAIKDAGTFFSRAQLARLREVDPEIIVLRYINSAAVYDDDQVQEVLDEHPDWVLRDESGEPVETRFRGHGGIMMNPASQGWRSNRLEKAYRFVTKEGYDGVLADEVLMVNRLPSDFRGMNTKTGEIYTTEEYRADQYEFVIAAKDTIGADKLLILNNLKRGSGYFEEQPYAFLEISDGVMAEGFRGPPRWPPDKYLDEEEWNQNLEMILDVQSRGKIIIVWIKVLKAVVENEAQLRAHDLFMYTTFLLGVGETSYYGSGVHDFGATDETLYYDYWQIDVGEPLSSYEKSASHYQREFENVRVLVNPTDNTRIVDLGTQFTTSGGQTVSEVTLNPHTGTILLK